VLNTVCPSAHEDSFVRFDPVLSNALEPVLHRGAFFAETHAIKGLLALDRLQRMVGFEYGRLEEILGRGCSVINFIGRPSP
jgi:hypothetical protein